MKAKQSIPVYLLRHYVNFSAVEYLNDRVAQKAYYRIRKAFEKFPLAID